MLGCVLGLWLPQNHLECQFAKDIHRLLIQNPENLDYISARDRLSPIRFDTKLKFYKPDYQRVKPQSVFVLLYPTFLCPDRLESRNAPLRN